MPSTNQTINQNSGQSTQSGQVSQRFSSNGGIPIIASSVMAARNGAGKSTAGSASTSAIISSPILLEELLRTSPSLLAFDPQTRAQFMAKIETMNDAQKEGLRQILLEERQTMQRLDEEEAQAKAKARQKVVTQFEVDVTSTVHNFERNLREQNQKPAENNDQEKAEALLQNL